MQNQLEQRAAILDPAELPLVALALGFDQGAVDVQQAAPCILETLAIGQPFHATSLLLSYPVTNATASRTRRSSSSARRCPRSWVVTSRPCGAPRATPAP